MFLHVLADTHTDTHTQAHTDRQTDRHTNIHSPHTYIIHRRFVYSVFIAKVSLITYDTDAIDMKYMVFEAMILHCKAKPSWRPSVLMR